jgi:4-hydroxy-tetrahydrodipicolinate synthase
MTLFKGAGVAIVTPFSDGKVDFPSLQRLIDWQIEQGIDAIISCGTTGEASTLNDKEHIETVEFTVKQANGRVPVIGGAGSNDTAHAIYMSKELEKIGASGLLHVTPYYNKCTQKGLVEHFKTIADSVNIPIILYSVPGRTGVNISPSSVFELAQHPNIKGIKEASGDISQVVEIARAVTDDFALYSGNDDMIVPLLSVGGTGAISTVANVMPKETHEMIVSYLDGDIEKAKELQLKLKPLIDSMFMEVNPIPVKAALNMMGYIKDEYRMPLSKADNKTLYEIICQLRNLRVRLL